MFYNWWVIIKKQFKIIILSSLIFISIFSIFIPNFFESNLKVQNVDIELNFNEENAFQYIQDQLDIGYRIPGTQERVNCANYFISKFQEIDSNFTYILHNFTVLSIECQNVLFKLNKNYSNIVIIGAHYDTRAKATKDITNPDDPVPGANDGASGCAVLLELAKVIYERRNNLSCQIWFLFFDAEDQGNDVDYGIDGWGWCEGSEKFVDEIDNFYNSENETFDCMILLDMVGGVNLRFINEQYSTSSLLDEIFEIGRNLGYIYEFPKDATSNYIIDDHKAFVDNGIPSAD
ncbi:MAG: M28 family peptidase, partial [Promethearchaeota archaeon]